MRFGRDDLEWDELRHAAGARLRVAARAGGLTTYSELNAGIAADTGLAPFDLGGDGGRHALGQLLGDVSREDHPRSGVLLSALCTHKGTKDVGGGFFELAVELGLLAPKSSAVAREAFRIKSVQAVYAAYAGGTRR